MGGSKKSDRIANWYVLTSAGMTVSIGKFLVGGGTTGDLYLSKDPRDKDDTPGVVILTYEAGGAGAGVSPWLFDGGYSSKDMPSNGLIYHGSRSDGTDLELHDFTGLCVLTVVAQSFGVGGSLTTIYFQPLSLQRPTDCKAYAVVPGMGVSLPGASAMVYIGSMHISAVNPLESKDPVDTQVRQPKFQTIPKVGSAPGRR